jgi:hypothetical protein
MNGCLDRGLAHILLAELPHSREARRFHNHARRCARCADTLSEFRSTALLRDAGTFPGHPGSEDISYYLDTLPGDPALTAITLHLEGCESCRHRVDAMILDRRAAALKPARNYKCRQRGFIRFLNALKDAVSPAPWPRTGLALTGATAMVILLSFGYWRNHSAVTPLRPKPLIAVKPGSQSPGPHSTRTLVAAIDDGVVTLSPSGRISTSPTVASLGKLLQSTFDAPVAYSSPDLAPIVGPVRAEGDAIGRVERLPPIRLCGAAKRTFLDPQVRLNWVPIDAKRVAYYALEVEEVSREEPVRVQRHLRGGPFPFTLTPGRRYRWRVQGKDAEGLSVTSSPAGQVYVMSAAAAMTIKEHPDAHLLRGLLYEREGALDEALSEYRQLRPGPDGMRVKNRLIQRVKTPRLRVGGDRERVHDTP